MNPGGFSTSTRIPRTVTELFVDNDVGDPQPLSAFRNVAALVLLGEPGSGKSTLFEQEREAIRDAGHFVTAREFRRMDGGRLRELGGKVLFIDGLDETRAGGKYETGAVDEIQARLLDLGRPIFRISCRAADWFGPVDRLPLTSAALDSSITTLRLDPLTRSDVRSWLSLHDPDLEAAGFMLTADQRGFGPMLDNPQTLKYLYEAVADGGWPATRSETFQRACERLASEHNDEHPRATELVSTADILDIAARLSAIQLLSGAGGISFESDVADPNFVAAAAIAADLATSTGRPVSELRRSVATNLFKTADELRFEPIHRQIAEYLGASHLAELIDNGVISAGRVCAAMASPIGNRVVTDFRGLAAWLCTRSETARRLLIEADPVGMALYGDISEWPAADRRRLFEALVVTARPEDLWGYPEFDEGERRYRDRTAWSFRSLCKPDMLVTIKHQLGSEQRAEVPPHLRELVLRALSEVDEGWRDELTGLATLAERIIFEPATRPAIRLAAIAAYAWLAPSGEATERVLLEFLDAIGAGNIEDPDGDIAGSVLRLLYPETVTPANVWSYLPLLQGRPMQGESWHFWRHVVCDKTPADRLPQLLDGFSADTKRLWPILTSSFTDELPHRLLNRALNEIGGVVAADRLYRWIASVEAHGERRRNSDLSSTLSRWLTDNEPIMRQLRRIWIERTADEDTGLDEKFYLRDLLVGTLPRDFLRWCVARAKERVSSDPLVARAFMREAYSSLPGMHESFGASMEDLRAEIGDDQVLRKLLEQLAAPSSTSAEIESANEEWRQRLDEIHEQHARERRDRQADWLAHLRDHISELGSNTFPAPNLQTMALAYFGLVPEVSEKDTPLERVADLIGDDEEILEVVVGALRDAPHRDDVPTAERTAELAADSKRDWLAYPVLAGLAIREAEGTLDSSVLTEDLRRSAVAIYATTALDRQQRPAWPVLWLCEDPALVLGVCHRCAAAAVKKGDTHLSMLNWLLDIEGLHDELRDFRLRLLKSMSVRLPGTQLSLLDDVLRLVLQHPDSEPLNALIRQKLASRSMTDAQRTRWLTVDLLVNGATATAALEEFIGSKPTNSAELAQFLSVAARPSSYDITFDDDVAAVAALIRIVGRSYPPRDWGRQGEVIRIGPAEEMSSLIQRCINVLGKLATDDAGVALDALMADDRLCTWHDHIAFARHQQLRLHSDVSYTSMSLDDVLDLLRNGPPANVADLHALLCGHLTDLDEYIRGDNSDPWRDFWEDERQQRPSSPRHEETCRDALLRMLRFRLPEGVRAEPEGDHAADKRCDIDVYAKNFKVPIEIKKNTHRDLWTAIHDQLIAKYTTDPETGGYGIYVVLWLGSDIEGYPRHPADRDRPETPDELARRLRRTLAPEQRRRVTVVVLDVTKPGTGGAAAD